MWRIDYIVGEDDPNIVVKDDREIIYIMALHDLSISQRCKSVQDCRSPKHPITEKIKHFITRSSKDGDTVPPEKQPSHDPSTVFNTSDLAENRQLHQDPPPIDTCLRTTPCCPSRTELRALEDRIENAEFAGVSRGPTARDTQVILRIRGINGQVQSVLCPWQDFKSTEAHNNLISHEERRYIENKYLSE